MWCYFNTCTKLKHIQRDLWNKICVQESPVVGDIPGRGSVLVFSPGDASGQYEVYRSWSFSNHCGTFLKKIQIKYFCGKVKLQHSHMLKMSLIYRVCDVLYFYFLLFSWRVPMVSSNPDREHDWSCCLRDASQSCMVCELMHADMQVDIAFLWMCYASLSRSMSRRL